MTKVYFHNPPSNTTGTQPLSLSLSKHKHSLSVSLCLTQQTHSLTHSLSDSDNIYGQQQRQRRSSDIHEPIFTNHSLGITWQLPHRPKFSHRQRLRELPERRVIIWWSRYYRQWRRVRFLSPGLQDESTRRLRRVLPAPRLPLLQESQGLAPKNRSLWIRSCSQVALCCCNG